VPGPPPRPHPPSGREGRATLTTTDELTAAIVDLRERDAVALTDRLLDEDVEPHTILDASRTAMDEIGRRFACGRAFIPELVVAGEIMKAISTKLKPKLARGPGGDSRGVVVLGTAQGDIHDLGKDIVATMLDIAGFEVIDLGVDVDPARFVEVARRRRPAVVGISALLTQAIRSMEKTIAAIDADGLRPEVRVMIGGAPVTDAIRDHTAADGWGKDAVEAVELARTWLPSDDGRDQAGRPAG